MMSEENSNLLKKFFQPEDIILTILMILSVIGVGIIDFDPVDGFVYWLLMSVVFAGSSILICWLHAKENSVEFKTILREQSTFWLITSVVVLAAYLVEQSDRIHPEDAGLVILLILSLSAMLNGIKVSWRLSLIGVYLGMSAVISAFAERFFWVEILLAIAVFGASVAWEMWLKKKAFS